MSNILNNILKNKKLQKQISRTSRVLNAAIPKVDDPTLQTWIKAIDDGLKTAVDQSVSKGDLVDLGLAGFKDGKLQGLVNEDKTDFTVPLAVRDLKVSGGYSTTTLSWITPKSKVFGRNVVYRAEVNDFGKAVEVGSSIGDIYTDYVGNNAKVYYWVRTLSKYEVEGDLSPSVYVTTSLDIPFVLNQLTNKITSNQLVQSLKTEIDKIPGLASGLQTEVNNRVSLAEDTALKFLNLRNDLNTSNSTNNAAILNVQNTLTSQIETVAQEISLVTAGVGEQFDTYLIWFFDENTTEGWTSIGGNPTVNNGWIIPYINGANTALISPPDLLFSGTKYPHIRFRVQRIGNPTWNARIYWGENFNLYMDIPDPIWIDGEIATVQQNMEWLGNIGQIKLVIGNDQNANNYFMVDWFSFGRPSPSASWASLGEIKTAVANENYARTEYQRLNDARWASNDTEYRALINEAMRISADADGVIASRIDEVQLMTITSYAGSLDEMAGSTHYRVGIKTEEYYRIEGDYALGERIDQIYVTVNEDITAAIREESRVRASENEAMAEQISSLHTQVNEDISAAIQEESRVRAEQNTAMAEQISTLHTQVNKDISAAIREESRVRTEQNTAIAETINTVQTSVGKNTTSIQQAMTSIDGINAEWKVKIDSNGTLYGLSFGVNGETSAFNVLANQFNIINPKGGSVVPFSVEGENTYINNVLIKDASITNAKVGDLSADKITTGDIHADRMKTNIVEAVQGKFETLSSITATIGHLRTKTTGARTEIRDNLIEVFDEEGRTRVRIGVWEEE